MELLSFVALAAVCAPLIDVRTSQAVVAVESAFNPHAIGVVGGVLERQPHNHAEALATTKALRAGGWNFSVGLGQINVRNLGRLGLTVEQAFDPCANLAAMQRLLGDCFERAGLKERSPQLALRRALSCYYSGNFVTGFREGYVNRVLHALDPSAVRPHPTLSHTREFS